MLENIVYVGNKPLMSYVLAVVKEFNTGTSDVTIKARGRAISKAVDVAEVSKNKFIKDVDIKSITTGTEQITSEAGEFSVSTIELVVSNEKTEKPNINIDNVVFIGNKPLMSYVLAVVKEFNTGTSGVAIKARGRAISKAVDVAEVSKNKFIKDVDIKSITTGTEQITSETGDFSVSTIELVMCKNNE